MNEDSHSTRSWLERLSHVLLREPKDREQLIELLHDAKERNLLDHDALTMIEGVLKISEMKVRDAMIPRAQMIVIDQNATPQSALPQIIDSAHSRFPVLSESRDHVIGILLAKDLLQYRAEEEQKIRIKDLVRPAVLTPESKRLDILLKEFRLKRYHMAIVLDEYGSISGLITIEDILEQIVGSIEDETDVVAGEPNITQFNYQEFTVKALTPIAEFNEYFKTNIDDESFDTIGGYVIQQFGYLPRRGESIQINDLKITVILANKRRVQLLRLIKQTPEDVHNYYDQ